MPMYYAAHYAIIPMNLKNSVFFNSHYAMKMSVTPKFPKSPQNDIDAGGNCDHLPFWRFILPSSTNGHWLDKLLHIDLGLICCIL